MSEIKLNEIYRKQDNSFEIIQYFKKHYVWFERRWATMEMNHKNLLGKMLDTHPLLGFYTEEMIERNSDKNGEIDVWRVSSTEADVLCLLALPYDDSEMVLTDDTGLVDTNGNKILSGGEKSFKAQ